jgi:hypothetical protein
VKRHQSEDGACGYAAADEPDNVPGHTGTATQACAGQPAERENRAGRARVPQEMVLVEILVTPECPSEDATIALVGKAARDVGVTARVMLIEIRYVATAAAYQFAGSSTMRVDGVDVEPMVGEAAAFACRLGLPSLDRVRAALAEAACRG